MLPLSQLQLIAELWLLECDKLSAAKRWQTVNELLHAHQTDKTRTDAENKDLVNSFSTFFVSKISGLKSAVSNKLAVSYTHLTLPTKRIV